MNELQTLEERVADLELCSYRSQEPASKRLKRVPQVGEVVLRRGRLATVLKIDSSLQPPCLVLRMNDAGEEVNTELDRIELISMTEKASDSVLCLMGETGVGKSSLAALISGQLVRDECGDKQSSVFPVSNESQPCTRFAVPTWCKWLGEGDDFKLIDTPGLGAGSDDKQIQDLVRLLKQLRFISCFVLVFNAEQVRFTEQHRHMVQLFHDTFGQGFFGHLAVVFTHWPSDKKSIRRRGSRNEAFVREKLLESFKAHLSSSQEDALKRLPVFFVDALFDEEEEQEQEQVLAVVERFRRFAHAQLPFDCTPFASLRPQQPGLLERRQKEGLKLDVAQWEHVDSIQLSSDNISFFGVRGVPETIRLLPWETLDDLKREALKGKPQSGPEEELVVCCILHRSELNCIVKSSIEFEVLSLSKPIGDCKHKHGFAIIPASVICDLVRQADAQCAGKCFELVRFVHEVPQLANCYIRFGSLLLHPELGLLEFIPAMARRSLASLTSTQLKKRLEQADISFAYCIEKGDLLDIAAQHARVEDASSADLLKLPQPPAKLSMDFEDGTYTKDFSFQFKDWYQSAELRWYDEMHGLYSNTEHFALPPAVAAVLWKCLQHSLSSAISMYGIHERAPGYFPGSWSLQLTRGANETNWVECTDGDAHPGAIVPARLEEYAQFLSKNKLFIEKSESGPG